MLHPGEVAAGAVEREPPFGRLRHLCSGGNKDHNFPLTRNFIPFFDGVRNISDTSVKPPYEIFRVELHSPYFPPPESPRSRSPWPASTRWFEGEYFTFLRPASGASSSPVFAFRRNDRKKHRTSKPPNRAPRALRTGIDQIVCPHPRPPIRRWLVKDEETGELPFPRALSGVPLTDSCSGPRLRQIGRLRACVPPGT